MCFIELRYNETQEKKMLDTAYSYKRYCDVPMVCRSMHSFMELIALHICPDPRIRLEDIKPERLTRKEEQEKYPERWLDKACLVCGLVFGRTGESWNEWDKRIVCGRKCGARYRTLKSKKPLRKKLVMRSNRRRVKKKRKLIMGSGKRIDKQRKESTLLVC